MSRRQLGEFNSIGAIDLSGNNINLFRDGKIKVIEESEFRFALTNSNDSLCKRPSTFTALCPVVANHGTICAPSKSFVADECKFGFSVGTVFMMMSTYVKLLGENKSYANWFTATITFTPNFFEF